MTDYIKHKLNKVFNIDKVVTIFYMEFSKDFFYEGESHDFWELVYIDKGEMICTVDNRQFVLKGGEMVFHKPKQFHNHTSNKVIPPNLSIVTFECKNSNMRFFNEKIIKLNAEEKKLLSQIINEGQSAFVLKEKKPPVYNMIKKSNYPFGSLQMIKILLEQLLITLYRKDNFYTKAQRRIDILDYEDYPEKIKEIIKYLHQNIENNLSLKEIAKHFNMSESKLKKRFNFYIKKGIINYYIDLKITKAKKLIREESLNFTEISYRLGYLSVNYFCKQFKNRTNMTPSQYSKSIKN